MVLWHELNGSGKLTGQSSTYICMPFIVFCNIMEICFRINRRILCTRLHTTDPKTMKQPRKFFKIADGIPNANPKLIATWLTKVDYFLTSSKWTTETERNLSIACLGRIIWTLFVWIANEEYIIRWSILPLKAALFGTCHWTAYRLTNENNFLTTLRLTSIDCFFRLSWSKALCNARSWVPKEEKAQVQSWITKHQGRVCLFFGWLINAVGH